MFENITSIDDLNKAISNLAFFGPINERINEDYRTAKSRILSASKSNHKKIKMIKIVIPVKEVSGYDKLYFEDESPMEMWIDD